MKELGIDMSENTRTQLTREMINDFDKVIVLAEPESIPDYLKLSPKAEIWAVEDAKGKTVDEARKVRDEINRRVIKLAKELQRAK